LGELEYHFYVENEIDEYGIREKKKKLTLKSGDIYLGEWLKGTEIR
jgi:hypothetical protein